MRQQTQDLNQDAVLARKPAMIQASRTAAIANNHKNKEQGKLNTLNQVTSSLNDALQPYIKEQQATKQEAAYQEAYTKPGTQKGRKKFLEDNKRTGFTAALFGGQTPEYKGTLDASAKASAGELYVEQAAFVESDQADMTEGEYYKQSTEVVHNFLLDNFKDSPDAANAFMKQWKPFSNALFEQHTKLQLVRDQQNARKDFNNQWQTAVSTAKTLTPNNPEAGHVVLQDLYDYDHVATNMEKPAWTSAVIENTTTLLSMDDTSTLEAFNTSGLKDIMSPKQRTAFNTSISKIDTNNVNRVANYNDELEISLQAAKTEGEVNRAFETHASSIINLGAKNTYTAKHMATISGGNVFRGKLAEVYDKKRHDEQKENIKLLKDTAKFEFDEVDYNLSTMKGNTGEAIIQRSNEYHKQISNNLASVNNRNLPLEVRSLYLKEATKHQNALEGEGDNVESALSSKANLIQSEISLLVEQASSTNSLPNIPEGLIGTLRGIYNTSQSPNTKTLVNNLLINASKLTGKAGKDYINHLNQEEKDYFYTGDKESQIGLEGIKNDVTKTEAQREAAGARYIENTITKIQEQATNPNLTKDGAKELQKQELFWKKELTKYTDRAAALAAKRAAALKKINDDKAMINSVRESWATNTSIDINASSKHINEASDAEVDDLLRTPETADSSLKDLVDESLDSSKSVLKLTYKLDNIKHSFKSPVLQAGMKAVLRRSTGNLPDEENVNNTKWSKDNKQAIEVLQTAYKQSNLLWNQLSTEEQSEAIYLMSAVNLNEDRAPVMKKLSTPEQEGVKAEPIREGGWQGIVHALKLDNANSELQNNARSMYEYLVPKISHKAALEHTRKLVSNAHVVSPTIDIKFGKSFPKIPVTTMVDGKEVLSSTSLEDISKGFTTFTPEIKTYGVTGVQRLDMKSPASTLLQSLVGNTTRKDGTAITDFNEVAGFSAEVIGDTVVFHSNYGVAELSIKHLSNLATDLAKGKQRYDRKSKQLRNVNSFENLRNLN